MAALGAFFCAALASCAATAPAGEPLALDYAVALGDPADERASMRLDVAGLAPGETLVIELPRRYAFATFDEPVLEGPPWRLRASGEREPLDRVDAFTYAATADAPELTLGWSVPLDHRRRPEAAGDEYEQPYVARDHGLFVTGAMLFAPIGRSVARTRVRFELPGGWDVVAPWPERRGAYEPPDLVALQNDLVAVGAWSTHELALEGCRIVVAVAPGQDGLARVAVPLVAEIVEAELELFGGAPVERYLFLFGRADTRGFGGSPKSASMTLSVDAGVPAALARRELGHLVAHEFHHVWAASRYDAPDELRFVNEGFTDWFAHLVLARTGIADFDAVARVLGRSLDRVLANRRRADLSLVAAGGAPFFDDPDATALVYDGGLLVAAWLDLELRARARDERLEDFMRALNDDPRWESRGAAPDLDDVVALVEERCGGASAARFRRLVTEPLPPDLPGRFARLGAPPVSRPDGAPRLEVDAWREAGP